MTRNCLCGLVLATLAGCSSQPVTTLQGVYSLGAVLDTAEKAALVYEQSPVANPTVVARIKVLDGEAYTALVPLLANQDNVSADAWAAAEAATEALGTYMVQQGVK